MVVNVPVFTIELTTEAPVEPDIKLIAAAEFPEVETDPALVIEFPVEPAEVGAT